MRYQVLKPRASSQDLDQGVFFWDGEVGVTSNAVTIGNPAHTTIAVNSLQGVTTKTHPADYSLGKLLAGFVMLLLAGIFYKNITVCVAFVLIGSVFFWKSPKKAFYEVTLKLGGAFSDHILTSFDKEWAQKFSESVTNAMFHKSSGGGGSNFPAQAILPDPVLTRN